MNMYDLNRFAGAILATILVVLVLGFGAIHCLTMQQPSLTA